MEIFDANVLIRLFINENSIVMSAEPTLAASKLIGLCNVTKCSKVQTQKNANMKLTKSKFESAFIKIRKNEFLRILTNFLKLGKILEFL